MCFTLDWIRLIRHFAHVFSCTPPYHSSSSPSPFFIPIFLPLHPLFPLLFIPSSCALFLFLCSISSPSPSTPSYPPVFRIVATNMLKNLLCNYYIPVDKLMVKIKISGIVHWYSMCSAHLETHTNTPTHIRQKLEHVIILSSVVCIPVTVQVHSDQKPENMWLE